MKIKTIQDTDLGEFEKSLNEANVELRVKFTQTHINTIGTNPSTLVYTAVIYYE